MKKIIAYLFFLFCFEANQVVHAQLITGYWKGRIDNKNTELKIIKNGDSITGTAYYYRSANNYARYSIRGYFDGRDNSVVWWDEVLLEQKGSNKVQPGYRSNADFNCPGGTRMFLTGNAAKKEGENEPNRPVALEKDNRHQFTDEWDDIIDNYLVGGNDPQLIDSLSRMAYAGTAPVAKEVAPVTLPKPAVKTNTKKKIPVTVKTAKPAPKAAIEPVVKTAPVAPLTNEQKFAGRSRRLMQEIVVAGDSIELHFYDNAEVDGDSIAIFLNNALLYEHVRLSDKPFSIRLAVADLQQSNELVMVAENLGSIPPNTSLMVAEINGNRYEARLESTEQSSALIRFVKKQ